MGYRATDAQWWIAGLAIDSGLLDNIVPVNLWVLERHREWTPEQAFYAAILKQAVEDLRERGAIRAEAIAWFRGGRVIVTWQCAVKRWDWMERIFGTVYWLAQFAARLQPSARPCMPTSWRS